MMKLDKEQIEWLMSLVNEYDAVSHPYALRTYVTLAKEFNSMPDTEVEYLVHDCPNCGGHEVLVDA